jgi:hypothetical protein
VGSSELEILQQIDAKLGALLALALLDHLPENAPARKRSIDQGLKAAGLEVGEIAALLGKSRQAVYKLLDEPKAKAKKPKPKAAG